jgi:hypothetical protein
MEVAPFQSLRCFFGHDVGSGVIYQDDNIKVMAVENTHFKLHQAGPAVGKYKSYSYRFDAPDRVVVFTAIPALATWSCRVPLLQSRR